MPIGIRLIGDLGASGKMNDAFQRAIQTGKLIFESRLKSLAYYRKGIVSPMFRVVLDFTIT